MESPIEIEVVPEEVELDRKRTRFKDAPWFGHKYDITVGGVGGIGSWLSLPLARMGHTLHVWDFDTIEEENIAGQLYSILDVGQNKTDAISEIVKNFADEDLVVSNPEKFTDASFIHSVCFSCFDNMKARKDMFESWVEEAEANDGSTPCVFIDGRLLYGNIQVYVVTKDNIAQYRESLFDDSEVAAESCTLKVTTQYAMIIAGLMASLFTNYLTNYITNDDMCPVPFAYKMEMTSLYKEVLWSQKS
jgi:molybdopterin/thiamine biosynthesis adenylyltransferase